MSTEKERQKSGVPQRKRIKFGVSKNEEKVMLESRAISESDYNREKEAECVLRTRSDQVSAVRRNLAKKHR
jgi:hypothetical protein